MKKLLLLVGFLFGMLVTNAQNTLSGRVIDAETKVPLEGVHITVSKVKTSAVTDIKGEFKIRKIEDGTHTVTIEMASYESITQTLKISRKTDLGVIELSHPKAIRPEDIPQIALTEDEQDDDTNNQQNVSELLTASRDPYFSQANFNLRSARFRNRGYVGNTDAYTMNGVPFNDLDDDRVEFGTTLTGLTGVTSNQTNIIGLAPAGFSFGNIGGSVFLDTRASYIRKTKSIGTAFSNRTYTNRITATYATGRQSDGWAYAFAASKRWATSGYVPGTNLDSYTYFGSVDRKINARHSLNLTVFGSPTVRGKQTNTVAEVITLTNNPYYNPNLGYQNGKVRNSSQDQYHLPTAILRHDFVINNHSSLMTAASFQSTRYGTSGIDWYNASNPRPDYYSKLPTYQQDDRQQQRLTDFLIANPNSLQLNFDNFYFANRNNSTTIKDVDGIAGNNVTGKRAHYIISERRTDSKEFNFNTNYQNILGENLTYSSGLTYQYFHGKNFNTVNDLLGADWFVNVDQFAERAFPDSPNSLQNNIDKPNQLLKVGDKYGYDYDNHINKLSTWHQIDYKGRKFDLFAAANVSYTNFWRVGNLKNGRFPDNSFGKSAVQNFLNYGVKGGATYKINGRNYLYANAAYLTNPPLFRDAYLSPRTRDNVIPGLTSETIRTAEVGYNLRAPKIKARLSAFYTYSANNTKTITFFNDGLQALVNYSMKGVNYEHKGVEFGAEYNITSRFTLNALASVGQYLYASRPVATITQDNDAKALDTRIVYINNYRIANTPQQAFSFGVKYSGKKQLYLSLNANYFRERWSEFNPDRRTEFAISRDALGADKILKGSALWNSILAQEKLPDAYVINANIGKSYRIRKYGHTILFNLSVDNITNNKFIVAAYEQLRFDNVDKNVNKFPSRYAYAWGTNYLMNITYRF